MWKVKTTENITLQIHHFHVSIFFTPKATCSLFQPTSGTGAKGVGLDVALGASGLSGTWQMGSSANLNLVKHLPCRTPRNHWSVGSRAKLLYIQVTEMERGHTRFFFDAQRYLKVSFSMVLGGDIHQFG